MKHFLPLVAFSLALFFSCGKSGAPRDTAPAQDALVVDADPPAASAPAPAASAPAPMGVPAAGAGAGAEASRSIAENTAEAQVENTAAELAQIAKFYALLEQAETTKPRGLGDDIMARADALSILSPQASDNARWGFVNYKGDYVIKPQFIAARDFAEGLASVQTTKQKWGFIDDKGETAIAPRFDRIQVTGFREGRVIAVARDTVGYINKEGTYIEGYFAIHRKSTKQRKK